MSCPHCEGSPYPWNCGRCRPAVGPALPPKTAVELERELNAAHSMIGRLMLLIFDKTDMGADDVLAAVREDASADPPGSFDPTNGPMRPPAGSGPAPPEGS